MRAAFLLLALPLVMGVKILSIDHDDIDRRDHVRLLDSDTGTATVRPRPAPLAPVQP